jgi:hypothetical protein
LTFSDDSALALQADRLDEPGLCLHLLARNGQPGLQATHQHVGVGGLGGDRQARGGDAGPRALILGTGRLLVAARAAEDVQLPAGDKIGLIQRAVAIEVGRGGQQAPGRRLGGGVGLGAPRLDRR